jgi:hypothetical protein
MESLRLQLDPEHVRRHRYFWLIMVVSMLIVVAVWLVQLKFTFGTKTASANTERLVDTAQAADRINTEVIEPTVADGQKSISSIGDLMLGILKHGQQRQQVLDKVGENMKVELESRAQTAEPTPVVAGETLENN